MKNLSYEWLQDFLCTISFMIYLLIDAYEGYRFFINYWLKNKIFLGIAKFDPGSFDHKFDGMDEKIKNKN